MNLLENIPVGWVTTNVGKYCDVQLGKMLQNDPSSELDERKPYLRAINIAKTGLNLSHDFQMWIKPQEKERFRLRNGDILVSEGGDAGRTAVFDSDNEYYFQNAINRVRPDKNSLILPEFIYYWFTFLKVSGYVEMICNVATIPHFTAEKVTAAPLALPPLDTQKRIAQFLDEKTAKIDGLIKRKRELLDRLAEKRQALITQTVTKGLNPDAPMKPSGIDWLGDIPAHWSLRRLRFSVLKIEQGWSPQCDNRPAENGEWGVLKVGCVNGEEYDERENKALPPELDPVERYEVRQGDILISRANTKELLGSAAIVSETQGRIIFCDKLYRLDLTREIDPKYMIGVLRSPVSRFQYEQEATGTSGSMQNIGQDTIKNLFHPLPPLKEQIEIGKAILTIKQKIASVEHKCRCSVSLLHEYRSALITSAVTGQIEALK